jgi:hypothetical protein
MYLHWGFFFLNHVQAIMVNLASVQGRQQIRTRGYINYFEDSNLMPNAEIG